MEKGNCWVIKPFNRVFWGLLIVSAIITGSLCYVFTKVEQEVSFRIIFGIFLFSCLLFVFYRLSFAFDKEYIDLIYPEEKKVNWYNELPFFPCNVVIWISPIAILTMNRVILGFCFYVSVIGPIVAICMPVKGFEKYELYKPRVFGYYVTHILALMFDPFMLSSGIFVPTMKDVFPSILFFMALGAVMYFVNSYLIKHHLNDQANYFFVMRDHDNPVLAVFYKLFPVPYFYTFLPLAIVMVICYIGTYIIQLFYR